jgi:hypothetical protein
VEPLAVGDVAVAGVDTDVVWAWKEYVNGKIDCAWTSLVEYM